MEGPGSLSAEHQVMTRSNQKGGAKTRSRSSITDRHVHSAAASAAATTSTTTLKRAASAVTTAVVIVVCVPSWGSRRTNPWWHGWCSSFRAPTPQLLAAC